MVDQPAGASVTYFYNIRKDNHVCLMVLLLQSQQSFIALPETETHTRGTEGEPVHDIV